MTITEQVVVTGHVVTAGIYHFLLLMPLLSTGNSADCGSLSCRVT